MFKKCLLGMIFLLVLPLAAAAETITLAADPWCPYTCEPGTDKPGFMVEIARTVLGKAGHSVVYKSVNWTRAIKDAREGKYSGIMGAYTEDAPDFVFPETDQGKSKNSLFVKKENPWKYTGIDSLKQVKIGIVKDYGYGEPLDGYFKSAKGSDLVQGVGGDDALVKNIKKMMAGRIDALVEDPNVFTLTAADMGVSDQITTAGDVTQALSVYIAFSPKDPKSKEYAKIITDGMAELRQSGELEKILARYGLKDWQ